MTPVIHFVLMVYVLQNCVIAREIFEVSNKPSCQTYSTLKKYIDKELWIKQNQLDTLLQKLDSQEKLIIKQQEQMDNMAVLLKKYESSLSNKRDLENKKRLAEGSRKNLRYIGFTARMDEPRARSGLLIFHFIIANYGNGYDTATGKFTCNISGLYIFNLSIVSITSGAQAFIMRNNNTQLTYAFTSFDESGTLESGSASAVVKLDVGDQIWVKSVSTYTYIRFSYFSGALISA